MLLLRRRISHVHAAAGLSMEAFLTSPSLLGGIRRCRTGSKEDASANDGPHTITRGGESILGLLESRDGSALVFGAFGLSDTGSRLYRVSS